jgi:hypothetical protein
MNFHEGTDALTEGGRSRVRALTNKGKEGLVNSSIGMGNMGRAKRPLAHFFHSTDSIDSN